MAFQLRRGLNAERQKVILAEGELVYTTDTKKLFAGDGTTLGGTEVSLDPSKVAALEAAGSAVQFDSAEITSIAQTTAASTVTSTVDSAYVQARQSTNATTLNGQLASYYTNYNNLNNTPNILDSSEISSIILNDVDAAYVQARVTLDGVGIDSATASNIADARIASADTHDSVAIQNQITSTVDSAYVQARVTLDGVGIDSAAATTIADARIASADTHDSVAIQNQITSTVDAAYVQARQTTYDFLDSAEALALIDSTHVRSKIDQTFIDTFDTHDSSAVQGQIDTTVNALDTHDSVAIQNQITSTVDSAYVQARQTLSGGLDSASSITLITDTVDAAYVQSRVTLDGVGIDSAAATTIADARIAAADTHDSAAVAGQITATVTQSFVNALNVDADTLDAQQGTYYLDYTNFTNTPIVLDSANVTSIINATDTHDSAVVVSQINEVVNQSYIDALDTHDSVAIQNMIDATIASTDTHDSALVSGQITSTVDAAYVQARQTTYDFLDSSEALTLIDSSYVRGKINQTFIDTFDTHDSAAVLGQINNTVNKSFVDNLGVDAATLGGNDSSYYTNASNISTGTLSADRLPTITLGVNTTGNYVSDVSGTTNEIEVSASTGSVTIGLPSNVTVDSNLTVGGYIGGPAVFTIDPAAIGDSTGKVVILGDLQVDGVQTTINSTTVSISDKNIVLADSAADASQADGAGITVNGANATVQYASTGDKWVFNKAPYYNANRILTTADDLHDSAAVSGQITSTVDSAYVQGKINQEFIDTFDTHDSTAIVNQINATVTQSFVNALNVDADTLDDQDGTYYLNYNNFSNTPTVLDSANVTSIINATDTHDSTAVQNQITSTVDSDYIESRRPAETIFNVVNNGFAAYQYSGDGFPVQSGNNPDIYLTRGKTYKFNVNASGHPFWIQTSSGAYNSGNVLSDSDGVTNNGQQTGNVLYTVPMTAPTQLYYVCQYHSGMNGNIYIDRDVGTDSAAVNTLISAADTHDSAAVQGQINSNFASGFSAGPITATSFSGDGSNLTGIAGATGGSTDQVFYENDQTVTANYSITTNKNAMTAGPITINSGVTVTIPTGSEWSIV